MEKAQQVLLNVLAGSGLVLTGFALDQIIIRSQQLPQAQVLPLSFIALGAQTIGNYFIGKVAKAADMPALAAVLPLLLLIDIPINLWVRNWDMKLLPWLTLVFGGGAAAAAQLGIMGYES